VPLPAGLAEDRTTLRADLTGYFRGWAPPVQKLIAALDPETTNRIEIHDIEPFDSLVRGNVALLGDAGTAPRRISARAAVRRWKMPWCWENACVKTTTSRWRCGSTKRCAATGCATWC
jgi:FAD-dependent urate hydroxylase